MHDISIEDEQVLDVVIQVLDKQRSDLPHEKLGYESNASFSNEELDAMFGCQNVWSVNEDIHKAVHEEFLSMAKFLDEILPPGRRKDNVLSSLKNTGTWALLSLIEHNENL